MTPPAVVFDHVTKRYARGGSHDALRDLLMSLGARGRAKDEFNALDDVSFTVARGEAVGVVGPNGSGKSTALKLMTGILLPTSGTVTVEGRIAPLIEVGAGFHPDLTGRENIWLNAAITGMTRDEARGSFDAIVAFSGLEEFLETPVKRYSSGMYMRLGFSIAAHMPAELLVVDEVLAVGDVGFRVRCIERMLALKREGRTILFVSHHGHQVRQLCDRVVYLKHGRKEWDGDTAEGVRRYQDESLAAAATAPAGAVAASGVRIDAATLVRGEADEPLASGAPLEVRVRWHAASAMAAPPVLSVAVIRADGVTACVLNTRERGVTLGAGAGAHEVVARFDALPLHAGKHHVEVLVWDAAMVTVLAQSAAGTLDVAVPAAAHVNRPGVFWPQGSFRESAG